MPEDIKLMPTGNVQIANALKMYVLPELAELKKQLDRIEKKLAEKESTTKAK